MKKIILGFSVLILFGICVYPFAVLIHKVLYSGANQTFSLEVFKQVFLSSSVGKAFWNTFWVSTSVSILCCLFGVPLAWLLSRTDLPATRKFKSLLCLPYAIPPYIGAISWIYLANPTTGLLNNIFNFHFLNIYSFAGLVWVESSFMYTFILLTAHASLERMDASFEEAARISGANPLRVFWDITLPLIKPAIWGGVVMVWLATAASFGVPALIGSPARIYLLTTQIYTFQKIGSISGLYKAGALSILLLLFAALMLWIQQKVINKNQFQTISGKVSRPSLIELGKYKNLIITSVCIFLFMVFVLPLFGIVISALSQVQGSLELSNFSLENYKRVLFETNETPRAFTNSILLGIFAASIACVLGLFLSYIQVKTKLKGRNLLDLFASLPYATPGTVIAFALILSFSSYVFGLEIGLYNTLSMLCLAYIIKYLSFSIKTIADGFRQVDDVLDEAARVSGANWTTTMKTIWFPLMKPSLVAAWFLIFMPVISELTMTIMLTGPGLETIGTVIFQMQEYADASGGGASVLASLVVLVVILINWLVKKVSQERYGL